jgi:hypothetical protein
MGSEEFVVCFICFALAMAVVVGMYALIKNLTAESPDSPRGDLPIDNANPKNIFDRVMQIRRLFSGLPREHWTKVLTRLYDDLQERKQISAQECADLKRALRPLVELNRPVDSIGPFTQQSNQSPITEAPIELIPATAPTPATVIRAPEIVTTPTQEAGPGTSNPSSPGQPRFDDSRATVARMPMSPAPWDRPDPTPRQPRKSLAEWSQSFMEERNIHWGELASGILIVGSALGLVLSLRRELQDTIPYFPALMFLLIALGVHYAGEYTLKRWRLRSTSRGLLLISLLLVPLNFLAGVLFNADTDSRRPLTDPWLWTAVIVGTSGAGWITWSATRFLLRKGHAALVLPVMLSGLSMIVLNRLPAAQENLTRGWTLLPIAAVLAMVYGLFARQLSQRGRVSVHTPTRVWILGGITLFALGNVYALFVMKQSNELQLLSSLAPVSAIWVIGFLWLVSSLNRVLKTPELLVQRLIGQGIAGLLWFALVALFAWTMQCPRDLFSIVALYSMATLLAAIQFRWYWFAPIGLGFAVIATLLGRGFANGEINWTEIASRGELIELLINGRAAILFLVAGGILAAATSWLQTYFAGAPTRLAASSENRGVLRPTQIRRWNLLMAVGFVGLGSVLGLIGAYRPTADFWDAMIGTILLYAVALFVIGMAISGGYRQVGQTALTIVGGLLVVAASFEACFGNRYLVVQLQGSGWSEPWRAELAIAISMTILSIAAWLQNRRAALFSAAAPDAESKFEPQVRFSAIGIVLGHLGLGVALLTLILEQYNIIGVALGSAILANGLLAAFLHRTKRQFWLETQSCLGVFFFTGLPFQSHVEQTIQLGSGSWAFWVAGALAIWHVTMQWMAQPQRLRDWQSDRWPVPIMPREIILAAVPLLLLLMVVIGLSDAVKREIWAVATIWMVPSWQMSGMVDLASGVLGAWTVLLFVGGRKRVYQAQASRGITSDECLILGTLMFMALWAVQGARWDADVRGASAVRWLMAFGGLFVAMLPCCWSSLRMSMDGSSIATDSLSDSPLPQKEVAFWNDSAARLRVVYTSVIVGVVGACLVTGTAVAGFLTIGPEVRGLSPQTTWLGQMRPDVSYGIPVAILLASVLLHGISQRQRILAMAGSYLLRGIVVFQLMLLIVSPHPQLATEWFVHIVQMVSAGMTIYGWGWYLFRAKCATPFDVGCWNQPIQMHTWFNGSLVTGLMILVVGKYWLDPAEPLGWIQSAGNLIGLITILLFLPLAWVGLLRGTRASWFVPLTIVALASATMLVVNLERGLNLEPGIAFVLLNWLWVLIALGLAVAHWWQPVSARSRRWLVGRGPWPEIRFDLMIVWVLVGLLVVAFSWRGFDLLPNDELHFLGSHGVLLLIGVVLGAGRQSVIVPYTLLPLASIWLLRADNMTSAVVLPAFLENTISLHLALAMFMALAWMIGNLIRHYAVRSAIAMPFRTRSALVFGRIMLGLALSGLGARLLYRFPDGLEPTDGLLFLMCTLYLIASQWCVHEHWRIATWTPFHLVAGAALVSSLGQWCGFTEAQVGIGWLIATGVVVLSWGAAIRYWDSYVYVYRQLRVPRLAATRKGQLRWLPLVAGLVASGICFMTMLCQWTSWDRWERQLVCMAPLLAAIGFVWLANAGQLAWQRFAAVWLFTLTAVLLSWTQVSREIADLWLWGISVQTYWVTGVGYLVYGFAVAHWLRVADTWRVTVQQSANVLLGLASMILLLIMTWEYSVWLSDVAPLSSVMQASMIAVMTVALAISLIVVALVPKHQAVAQNMALRQAHVYAAQGFLTASIVHMALTMPWLFQFGLQQYWPYIAMGLAFAGIGIWHLLQRRSLTVLAEPLATTLLFFPGVAALLSLGLESQTDRSLVMLMAGVVYGTLAVTQPSFWTRLTAFAFGNLALWLFIERYPLWNFQNHPQLWLIPPAVTALIVSRIEEQRLGNSATTTMRYLALVVIYVSSTSEIFIQGIGQNLAPPMILATLALLGMFAGMALKIREYIFLGALFLLVAMFTMVWHAQQQLNHVWPWWAFGISLGVATLVFFAIFEQRRNQRRHLSQPQNEVIEAERTDANE